MMVKDFGASGFTVSDEFIINAETPLIAVDGLIEDPVNPFTGNAMVSQLYHPQDFLYFSSPLHNPSQNNGNTYAPGEWFTYDPASGDIYDQSAWGYYGEG